MIRKHVSKRKGPTILTVGVNGQIKTIRFLRARLMFGLFICIVAVLSTLIMAQLYYQVVKENKNLFEKVAIRQAIYGDKGIIRLPCRPPQNDYQIVKWSNIYDNHFRPIFAESPLYQQFDYTLSDNLDVIPVAKKDVESTILYHKKVRVTDIKLIINSKNNRIGFSFILRNATKASRAISGTSFVILKNENDAVAYPSTKVRRGRPVNFRKGRPFYVARFKTVRHRVKDIEHMGNFTEATILVYSKHGHALVNKTVPILMNL
ncbi:MAG: hypothetical protein OMM_02404 [Candidatus Magnetoglobus multicellularis str. Araruama]|uniref:Uncharacterized protein n=1 Tax=Candidatus Magnetoglobus multicellularis str. Araruama TaxID=890399 RepID=A0A1V1P9F4_9BACT|nr:MAG: hypothetical protein OMM_02404 [Candidatus Magnetoglobus multicellularis str. Araruama]